MVYVKGDFYGPSERLGQIPSKLVNSEENVVAGILPIA